MTTLDRLDATHDPAARSWLDSANLSGCAFPLQNLPFGVFRRAQSAESFRGGVAIGDPIIDLAAIEKAHLFEADAAEGLADNCGFRRQRSLSSQWQETA